MTRRPGGHHAPMGLKDKLKDALETDGHTAWGNPKQREGESDEAFAKRKREEEMMSTSAGSIGSVVS